MNKQAQMAALRRIEKNAALLREVAVQITEEAARLEEQVKSAQDAIGAAPVRGRKAAKPELTDKQIIQLRASLTSGTGSKKIQSTA